MLRLIAYILLALGIILLIPSYYQKYKESRDRSDLLELIGLGIMIPSLIILVIGQFI